jgi:osmoprotectant transport system substrate-binding protein
MCHLYSLTARSPTHIVARSSDRLEPAQTGMSAVDHHAYHDPDCQRYTDEQRDLLKQVQAFNRELVAAGEAGLDLSEILDRLDPDPARYLWVDEGGGHLGELIERARTLLRVAPPLPGHVRYSTAPTAAQSASRPTVATGLDGRLLVAWISWQPGAGDQAALALVFVACGDDDTAPGEDAGDGNGTEEGELLSDRYDLSGMTVRVGSKDFTEQLVLGQIARAALEAAGAEVELTENLTSPDGPRNALLAGEVDAAWEYTGTAWINYLGNEEPIDDPMEQWQAVKDQDLEENGVFWTEPAPFDDTYGFAYPRSAVDEFGVETVSDLAEFVTENPDQASLCVDPTFTTREDGLPRIEEVYDFEWPEDQFHQSDFGVIYTSVAEQDPCNFAEIFTTDGRIGALDLLVLEDDQNGFISYLSAVMMMEEYVDANPEMVDLFEEIGEPITEEIMIDLNERVDVDGEFPEDVAEQYLAEEGFTG